MAIELLEASNGWFRFTTKHAAETVPERETESQREGQAGSHKAPRSPLFAVDKCVLMWSFDTEPAWGGGVLASPICIASVSLCLSLCASLCVPLCVPLCVLLCVPLRVPLCAPLCVPLCVPLSVPLCVPLRVPLRDPLCDPLCVPLCYTYIIVYDTVQVQPMTMTGDYSDSPGAISELFDAMAAHVGTE